MKNIVITGSTRGIGLQMAKVFLQSGCNVTISGKTEKSFYMAKATLGQYQDQLLFAVCNVQKKRDIEALWTLSFARWGSIDCWINNAGQNAPYEYIHDTDKSGVDAVVDTNIKGMVYGSQVAATNMIAQGSGQIWNMEGLGSNGMIQTKAILYGMTKSALTYFTKGLAKELIDTPVLCGRLSPGMMLTDFITKGPDGADAEVMSDPHFIRMFNILADRPDTVAQFLVPKMLKNKRQNAHIVWLTNAKAFWRFVCAPLSKRKLI